MEVVGDTLLDHWTPTPAEPVKLVPLDLPADWTSIKLTIEAEGSTWPAGRTNLAYLYPLQPNPWSSSVLYVPANRKSGGKAVVRVQERGKGATTLGTGDPGLWTITYTATRTAASVHVTGPGVDETQPLSAPPASLSWVTQLSGTGVGADDAISSGWGYTVSLEVR